MDTKRWLVFIVIVVAVVGGMVYMSLKNKLDISDIGKSGAEKIIGPEKRNGEIGDHVFGNKNAKVVLIEYGDYQCPGCKTAAPKAKAVAEKYKDKIALVFRNFPIVKLHPNSRAASATAEAAGLQGKFWEMHDLLYANQSEWQDASINERADIFSGYVKELGLDLNKYKQDIADSRITKKIDFDVAVGGVHGTTGTPSFTIGAQQIDLGSGDNPLEDAVKKALKEAGEKIDE